MKITDTSFLTRERALFLFFEDFRDVVSSIVPDDRRVFDWNDPIHDPQGMYAVDCRINGVPRPLFIFALPNTEINRLALEAKAKRTEAYNAEQEAISITNNEVIHAT